MAEISKYDWTEDGMVLMGPPTFVGSWVKYDDHKEAIVKLNVELVNTITERDYWRILAQQRGR